MTRHGHQATHGHRPRSEASSPGPSHLREALVWERRRIAREVHDAVGHGLAVVMLQVTSARRVMRRDPAAAEEALRSAEEAGRRSLAELRRTVARLRSGDEAGAGAGAPLRPASEIPALADQARAGREPSDGGGRNR